MLRKVMALLMIFILSSFAASVKIYKNEGCGHCVTYMGNLMDMLDKNGYKDVVIKDYMSDTEARKEVVAIQEKFAVPLSMQGHLLVLVDDKYLFEGHVPVDMMENYLDDPKGPVVVTQDKMDSPTGYMMLMDGKQHDCPLDQQISQCASGNSGNTDVSFIINLLPFVLLAVAGGAGIYSLRGN